MPAIAAGESGRVALNTFNARTHHSTSALYGVSVALFINNVTVGADCMQLVSH